MLWMTGVINPKNVGMSSLSCKNKLFYTYYFILRPWVWSSDCTSSFSSPKIWFCLRRPDTKYKDPQEEVRSLGPKLARLYRTYRMCVKKSCMVIIQGGFTGGLVGAANEAKTSTFKSKSSCTAKGKRKCTKINA